MSRLNHDASVATRGIQGEPSLVCKVHGGGVEGFEHDLCCLISVVLGAHGGLGPEDWVLLRGNTELVVEGVMQDLLHVVPVDHGSLLNRVMEGGNTKLDLGRITNVVLGLQLTVITGVPDDGGEHTGEV